MGKQKSLSHSLIKTSYHNHSSMSDGRNSLEEIVALAKSQGIHEVGISDHWGIPSQKGVDLVDIKNYVSQVLALKEKYSNESFQVRLGLEVSFFPQSIQQVRAELSHYPFDYLIGSVHCVDDTSLTMSSDEWSRFEVNQPDEKVIRYWSLVEELAHSRLCDVVGHMDVYKKFGYHPSIDISKNIQRALDAIAQNGMAVEVNTSGWHAPCKEQYPSSEILKGCLDRHIPFVITADSHLAQDVTRDIERGYQLLHSLGKPSFVRYSQRDRTINRD